jgi:hypothetical protein
VEIPDDLFTGDYVKASGNVRLLNHIFWSGQPKDFDLDSLRDRVRVYELVITEGNSDDIRFFIDPKALVELWPRIFLPVYVRKPWEEWLRSQGVQI